MATVTTTTRTKTVPDEVPFADHDEKTVWSAATTVKASNLTLLSLKKTREGDNRGPLSPAEQDELMRLILALPPNELQLMRRILALPPNEQLRILHGVRAEGGPLRRNQPEEIIARGSEESLSSVTNQHSGWQNLLYCIFPWRGQHDDLDAPALDGGNPVTIEQQPTNQ